MTCLISPPNKSQSNNPISFYECIYSTFFHEGFQGRCQKKIIRVEHQDKMIEEHRHSVVKSLHIWHSWALNLALRFLANKQKGRHCQLSSSYFHKGVKCASFSEEPNYLFAWVPKETSDPHPHIEGISRNKGSETFIWWLLMISFSKTGFKPLC